MRNLARAGFSLFFALTILSLPFSIPAGGGASFITENATGPLSTGFARILKTDPFTVTPDGFAILQFRPNNILFSETIVPASPLSPFGDLYVEAEGAVNTGVVITNPNPAPANINFGIRIGGPGSPITTRGTFTVPANSQLARFINEPPFNIPVPQVGILTFSSSLPVAATTLRGFTNERSEFIITTLLQGRPARGVFGNVVGQRRTVVGYIPVFADGGGWTTQLVLSTPGSADFAFGNAEFLGPDGAPLNVTADGQTTSTVEIPTGAGKNNVRIFTSGTGPVTRVGHIRITAEDHSALFNAFAILSFKRAGITVSATSVPVIHPGKSFRLYVEEGVGTAPPLRTSLAISNASSLPASVLLELMDLSGRPAGLTATVVIPPFGQLSRFLKEIPGFEAVPLLFRGTLQISTQAVEGISVVGLRGRLNERSDFLVSTVLAVEQAEDVPERDVAPVVAGAGYHTEIVLLNNSGAAAHGNLVSVSENGVHLTPRSN